MGGGRTEGLHLAEKGRTLEVTLVNPPENRFTPDMVAGLGDAVDRIESDDFDVLVITGSKRVFCKGFDTDAMKSCRDPVQLRRHLIASNGVFSRLARSPKPTVAAISGACMGGGFELALACHFRLCAEKTRFGLPEIWMNVLPGLGGFYRLAKLIGQAKAVEMVALGDLISAEEAFRLNIVNRVFPRSDFPDHVGSFVKALLMADQQSVREVIRLAACSATLGEEDNIRQGWESYARLAPWSQKT
ncbi:MAG: enoyl-CoA hydratase/isomerase family protein [Planctomycetota bacterium]